MYFKHVISNAQLRLERNNVDLSNAEDISDTLVPTKSPLYQQYLDIVKTQGVMELSVQGRNGGIEYLKVTPNKEIIHVGIYNQTLEIHHFGSNGLILSKKVTVFNSVRRVEIHKYQDGYVQSLDSPAIFIGYLSTPRSKVPKINTEAVYAIKSLIVSPFPMRYKNNNPELYSEVFLKIQEGTLTDADVDAYSLQIELGEDADDPEYEYDDIYHAYGVHKGIQEHIKDYIFHAKHIAILEANGITKPTDENIRFELHGDPDPSIGVLDGDHI